MRPAVAFAAGLVLGVLAGWGAAVVVRPAEAPAATPPSVAPERGPKPVVPPRVERRRKEPVATEPVPAAKPVDRAPILKSGDAAAIRDALPAYFQHSFSDTELAAATARLATARDAGDTEVFLALLQALGRSTDARARAGVVDVLGDPSYPLASLRYGWFHDIDRWLREGGVPPGIAAAARRRIDANRAAGDVRCGADKLLEMVARHGDADDLAWLETTTASREIGFQAVQALTQVPRAETAPIVAKLVAAGKVRGDDLVEYARTNPKPAWELLAPLVSVLNSGAALPGKVDASSFLRAYGAAAPETAMDEVRACLLGLRTPELRAFAVSAVQSLANRKIDVAAFQPIVDAPIDLLAQGGEIAPSLCFACMIGIQTNSVAWSVRAADALEAAAPRAGRHSQGFRDVAHMIRTEVGGPWRRK